MNTLISSQPPMYDPQAGVPTQSAAPLSLVRTTDPLLSAKQEVYNMFTHDLRSPLTAIQGCLEILDLVHAEEFTPRTKRILQVAARNTTRAIDLVNDLLDSQKVQAGKMELNASVVDLTVVFQDINLDISAWIEEFGNRIIFASTDLVVRANERMVGRILFNLISNALKFSPKGTTITVSATQVDGMAQISVSDLGRGIPKNMHTAIFDRFQQLSKDTSTGSSGLGLFICHDFVTLHGGKIWVTSEVEIGSTFHFTLPLG
jgi:signal transduction histidine kinase